MGIGAIAWAVPTVNRGIWSQEGRELTPSSATTPGGKTRHRTWRIEGPYEDQITLYHDNEEGQWQDVASDQLDYKHARQIAQMHSSKAAPTDGRAAVVAIADKAPAGVKVSGSGWWERPKSGAKPSPVYVGLPVTSSAGAHRRSGVITDVNKTRTRITVELRDSKPERWSWRKGPGAYYKVGSSATYGALQLGKGVDYFDPGV